jgi:hypothetical protein
MDFLKTLLVIPSGYEKNPSYHRKNKKKTMKCSQEETLYFLKCLPLAKEKFHTERCPPTTPQKSTWCLMIVKVHQKVRIPNVELVLAFS